MIRFVVRDKDGAIEEILELEAFTASGRLRRWVESFLRDRLEAGLRVEVLTVPA